MSIHDTFRSLLEEWIIIRQYTLYRMLGNKVFPCLGWLKSNLALKFCLYRNIMKHNEY